MSYLILLSFTFNGIKNNIWNIALLSCQSNSPRIISFALLETYAAGIWSHEKSSDNALCDFFVASWERVWTVAQTCMHLLPLHNLILASKSPKNKLCHFNILNHWLLQLVLNVPDKYIIMGMSHSIVQCTLFVGFEGSYMSLLW